MKNELRKSLTDLIDETLLELEELKKSRFSAANIDLSGPGADNLAGKPVNGSLTAKAEDNEEEPEDDEGEVTKADDEEPHDDDPKHEEKEKEIAKKLLDMHKNEDDLKKSISDMEVLMKGYIDGKIAPLEDKLSAVLDTVLKMANTPVPAKGVSYKGVAPLMKSVDGGEPLSKTEVASKLLELKKSGSHVDSSDIALVEMGHDLNKIAAKYNIQ